MKKIFVIFTVLICTLFLSAAPAKNKNAKPAANQNAQPAVNQNVQPTTITNVAKSYTFAEELIEIPIKPFVPGQLSNDDLMNTSPQLLKLYETAVNAEKQANVFSNPEEAIKAWTELAKIIQNNPFFYTATARLNEWKQCIELFNKHQESIDKIKMLLASTLISDEQKANIIMQHLSNFGLSFGTQEIVTLVGDTAVSKNAAFQTKIKETKQNRCEHNSGKDCFECAKLTNVETDRLPLFEKSCGLRFQLGCEEVNKIKATKEAEKAKLAEEEKRKVEEFTKRTFTFEEEPLNLIKPFVLGQISEQDILAADPQVIKMIEETTNKEKQPDAVKTPGAMIVAWEEITKITEKNPFLQIAKQRLAEWKTTLEILEKHEIKAAKMKEKEADQSIPSKYRAAFAVNYLKEFGVSFGTSEVVKATIYLDFNADLINKIKEIRKQRCDLNASVDCHTYGLKHSANETEKAAYLKKACDLGRKQACPGYTGPQKTQSAPAENTQPQVVKQPKETKKEPSEQDKFKEELNQAGRKKRLAIATSTLVAGVVIGALGGVSFYAMNKAKKDKDKYLKSYSQSTTQEDMDLYRKKTNDADKKRKTYLILGGVGAGIGAALIATGITFYCIEFESEKEVKKKYNVSFGASPMDGTLQFALNW